MQQNAARAELLEFNLNEMEIGPKLISKKGSNRLFIFSVLGIEIEQSKVKNASLQCPGTLDPWGK